MIPKLMAIAESVVLEQVLAHTFPVAKKSRAGLVLTILAGLLVVVGLGFLIDGFHTWVANQYAPDVASLITAVAVFALALLSALVGYGVAHQRQIERQVRVQSMKHDLKNNIQAVFSAFDDELGDHVRENPATAVALASLAGFILADRIL